MYSQVTLKHGREKSLFFKHPWIFSGALEMTGEIRRHRAGSVVDIMSSDNRFLARGYLNLNSDLALRVLTFDEKEMIDDDFWVKRLQQALAARRPFINTKKTNAYRVVFAEADMLPGLIIDKYDDVYVLQIHTLGMDVWREAIVKAMISVLEPKAIYERSDVKVRKRDGLSTQPKGILYGEMPEEVEIMENGMKFMVDVVKGQKTGFFLDQRENRQAMVKYVKGKRVLNLFAYSGGFSVYALQNGAEGVVSVDASEDALALCEKNMDLNEVDAGLHKTIESDVFDYLEHAARTNEKFDVVIVDPPAFAKAKKDLQNALMAYSRLNQAALSVLRPGGILMTSSCSSLVSPQDFRKSLFQAGLKAQRDLTLLEQRLQPYDHPLKIFFPEGEYLKFFVLKA